MSTSIIEFFRRTFGKKTSSESFKCGVCGKTHTGLPMDMAYIKPADYFKILPRERKKRIKISDDICVIDDKEYYIRGVLPIPIINSNDIFQWGVWARIEEMDFKTYLKYWDGDFPENQPVLNGLLSGEIKDYPDSDMLDVQILLQANDQRPMFVVKSNVHPLGIDQNEGISMGKVHTFVEPLLNSF